MPEDTNRRFPSGSPDAWGTRLRPYSKDPSDPAMYLGMFLEHGDRKRFNEQAARYSHVGEMMLRQYDDDPEAQDLANAWAAAPGATFRLLGGARGMAARQKIFRDRAKQKQVASIISEMKGKSENEIYHALLPLMGSDDAAKTAKDIDESRVPAAYPVHYNVRGELERDPLIGDVAPGARLHPDVERIAQTTDVIDKVEKIERTSRIGNVLHGMYDIPHGAVGWRGTAARWLGSAIGPMHEGFAQRVHDFAQGGAYDRKKIAALDTDLHKYGISLIEYLTGEGGARVSEPEKQMALEKAGQLSGGGDWTDQVGRIESLSRTLIAIDEQIRAERGEDLEFPVATKKEYDASYQKLLRLRYPPEVADSILERLKFGYGG